MNSLLVIAAAFRLPWLNSPGYGLDELWTAEICSGRGGVHLHFPINQIINPPKIFDLSNAPPWWHVWTHMEATHPPLYYILLRLWSDALGDGDWAQRLFAVFSSLIAVGLLFDVARLTNGRAVAIWACLLLTVAPLQIDFARKTRNYALVLMVLLATADAVVRIEKFGGNRKRLLGLLLGALATPLTHYLSIGAIAGIAVYAAVRLRGSSRIFALSAFALAAVIFSIIWGPFFYAQRALFSVDNPGVSFVKDAAQGHIGRVIDLLFLIPAKMLVPRARLHFSAYAMALFYVVPFIALRRRPGLLLFALWLIGDVAALVLLDLTRSSLHLGFARYILMAGPAVYVLIPALCWVVPGSRWMKHVMPAAAVALCCCYYRDGYFDPAADPHVIVRTVQPMVGPTDMVVFASSGELSWTRGVQAMMLIRYLHPFPCPILFLDGPVPDGLRQRLKAAHRIVIFSSSASPSLFLPGFNNRGSVSFPSWGTVSEFTGNGLVH